MSIQNNIYSEFLPKLTLKSNTHQLTNLGNCVSLHSITIQDLTT